MYNETMNGNWEQTFFLLVIIVLIVDIALRGIALWHAAQNKSKTWFIALLLVNSIGILPAIYLLLNRPAKKNK